MLAIAPPIQAGQPLVIYNGEANEMPRQPQACVTAAGIAHLTFGLDNRVLYCNNDGEEFNLPKVAVQVPNLSLGMRRGPRITETGRSIVITAIGGRDGKGKDGDVLAFHSDDKEATWNRPVRVNDVESSAREGLHAMTATQNGVLWCVWLDMLTTNPLGQVSTVWRRGGTIYSTDQRRDTESVLGNGEQPWIASNSQGTTIVWTTARQGDLLLARLDSREPEMIAVDARDPVLVAGESSNPVQYVFWEQFHNNQAAIMGLSIR